MRSAVGSWALGLPRARRSQGSGRARRARGRPSHRGSPRRGLVGSPDRRHAVLGQGRDMNPGALALFGGTEAPPGLREPAPPATAGPSAPEAASLGQPSSQTPPRSEAIMASRPRERRPVPYVSRECRGRGMPSSRARVEQRARRGPPTAVFGADGTSPDALPYVIGFAIAIAIAIRFAIAIGFAIAFGVSLEPTRPLGGRSAAADDADDIL